MNIRIMSSLDESSEFLPVIFTEFLSCKTAGIGEHAFLCPTVPAVLHGKQEIKMYKFI